MLCIWWLINDELINTWTVTQHQHHQFGIEWMGRHYRVSLVALPSERKMDVVELCVWTTSWAPAYRTIPYCCVALRHMLNIILSSEVLRYTLMRALNNRQLRQQCIYTVLDAVDVCVYPSNSRDVRFFLSFFLSCWRQRQQIHGGITNQRPTVNSNANAHLKALIFWCAHVQSRVMPIING